MSILVNMKKKGPKRVQSAEPLSDNGTTWFDSDTGEYGVYSPEEDLWRAVPAKPTPGSEYGYLIGGAYTANYSMIERMQFPFNDSLTRRSGDLSVAAWGQGCCNSSAYGFSMGGATSTGEALPGGGDAAAPVATIERLAFPFDEGSLSTVGSLNTSTYGSTAFNSSTHGYCNGYATAMDRLTFPFDAGSTVSADHLTTTYTHFLTEGYNSSTNGYMTSGSWDRSNPHKSMSTNYRVAFASDGSEITCGGLGQSATGCATFNSSVNGYISMVCSGGVSIWWGSFTAGSDRRMSFLTHTQSATSLTLRPGAYSHGGGINSSISGYICGGGTDVVVVSTVSRVDFPMTVGSAFVTGQLAAPRATLGAIDGVDFTSLFV